MAPIRGLLSSVIVALALASQVNRCPFSGRLAPLDPQQEVGSGSFIAGRLGVDSANVQWRSGYQSGSEKRAYVRQALQRHSFCETPSPNVAFKGESAVTFGSSFVKPKKIAATTPTVSVESLNGKYNGHPTTVEYLARPDGTAALTHVIQIQNADENTWYEAFVDAHSGELLSITDFSAEAAYRVLPIQKQDLPEGLELLTNPHDTVASPQGWHYTSTGTTDDHRVPATTFIAYKGTTSSLTSQSATGQVFDYTYDTSAAPSTTLNVNAARTNAFYVINKLHDIAYRYGFTEAAFNFQNDNFGKGGSGNDRVLMSVQDSSGTNNANFATPPDGQSGTCRMYIWTLTTPNRDGSLNNDIIVHEMTHGITNRLTGGGTARCLQTTESRGMGEGWSDALAEWTEQKSADIKDFVLAPYVTNNVKGIRAYPYSTSATTNPLRYSNVRGNTAVHSIGTIWANVLHQVYAALVAQYGWSPAAFTNPSGAEGNIVFAHLFFDSLAIQPCNPTFTTGRDAWIQADANRYGGANRCLIWKAFASRGVGVNAANYVDNFDVPAGC
ncbi:metalloprotease [Coprinellus micaceus]|uniref:Extracellular metalloproteinase n=1 Tax=Coprinellus micaceus TaxID=71717 RepID=A0A4Y7R8K4_COPMI|nr:metalloprotease [Coprinellus micaceus]